MSAIAKLCVVCVAEEHDPDEAEILDDYDTLCFNCRKPIGIRYGEEVYLLWRNEEEDGVGIIVSEDN